MSGAVPAASIERVRAALQRAQRLCVLTGAGMSAESGIPTFRDALTGLWARFDPMELASEHGFRAHPQRVWDWYASRRDGVRAAVPNAGHLALASYGRAHPGWLTLITQNVDDLHQRAGSVDVIRLHGDILQDRWLQRCTRDPVCDPSDAPAGRPPGCGRCGNLVRPGVVWFGEALPDDALRESESAAQRCDVMLVVGTSGAVYPAAGLAGVARHAGALVAIVNPHPSEIDDEAHE
jgi:NAD-dependent deacetylase